MWIISFLLRAWGKNRDRKEAFKISDGASRVNVLVVQTNEELEIARETAEVARQNKALEKKD